MPTADDVLTFWFVTHSEADWFGAKPEFDAEIARHFADLTARAIAGGLAPWRVDASSRLAEIIVLDQFTRQIHRGNAEAFSGDPLAFSLAHELVRLGLDTELEPARRMFAYLPFTHSERLEDHHVSLPLFESLGIPKVLESEQGHIACLARFGRYPRRNAALGRASTEEELAYIAEHDRMW